LKQEIKNLDNLGSHPQIGESYEVYESDFNIHVVMEYLGGGELHKRMKHYNFIPLSCITNIMKQLLMGVSYIHELGLMHRDLKPKNIMLKRGSGKKKGYVLKIVDFGLAEEVKLGDKKKRLFNRCGTMGYMAPEIFKWQKKNYNEKVDIFSLGVIFYKMLTGKSPFTSYNYKHNYMNT